MNTLPERRAVRWLNGLRYKHSLKWDVLWIMNVWITPDEFREFGTTWLGLTAYCYSKQIDIAMMQRFDELIMGDLI